MSRIDEKTVVPLGWVLGLFSSGIAITLMAAFWVFSVNERLGRIEKKLGITPLVSVSIPWVAEAAERKK